MFFQMSAVGAWRPSAFTRLKVLGTERHASRMERAPRLNDEVQELGSREPMLE